MEAATKKKQKRRRVEDIDPLHGLYSIVAIMALIIIVPIAFFLYNIIRDPITPTLVRNASDMVKDRTFGYLSARQPKSSEHES
jgi:peptidoglycan/LPS O-acetylase OafA/YrhL